MIYCPETGKRRFHSEAAAKQAMRHTGRHGLAPRLYTYRCEYCGALHLTSENPRHYKIQDEKW